jgi:hypothetical protein
VTLVKPRFRISFIQTVLLERVLVSYGAYSVYMFIFNFVILLSLPQ